MLYRKLRSAKIARGKLMLFVLYVCKSVFVWDAWLFVCMCVCVFVYVYGGDTNQDWVGENKNRDCQILSPCVLYIKEEEIRRRTGFFFGIKSFSKPTEIVWIDKTSAPIKEHWRVTFVLFGKFSPKNFSAFFKSEEKSGKKYCCWCDSG